jgi:ubiquinone/menaquinone biosynthesis C-methylase UbiE
MTVHAVTTPVLIESQEKVWDREYKDRGTAWSRRVMFLPDVFKGKTVLEAGVGDGKTLSAICEKNPKKVVAIDFSSESLKKAKELFDSQADVKFIKADLRNMPFKEGEFDVVVLYYVLNNLLETDRKKAVRESKRVLSPGGLLLFEDYAVGDFREETSKKTCILEPHTLLKKKGLICHYFTLREVEALFSGFLQKNVVQKERTPLKNKTHLVRKTITGVMNK